MFEALGYGLLTAGLTTAGGVWVASRPAAWLTEERLAGLLAVGGGVLLATLCFEMLPEAAAHGGEQVFMWFFAGIATVLLFETYAAPRLDRWFGPDDGCHGGEAPETHEPACDAHDHDHGHGHHHHFHGHHHDPGPAGIAALMSHGAACSAVGCLLVCTFFDGVALAAGFAVSVQLGLVLGVGLLAHLLPEGVVAASVLLAAGSSARSARRAAIAVGGSLLAGILAASLLGEALGNGASALPFAAGVITHVVLTQLVPIAGRHRLGLPLLLSVAVALGVIERVVPHSH